jgi:hypothetical protein
MDTMKPRRFTASLAIACCLVGWVATGLSASAQAEPLGSVGVITGITEPMTRQVVQRRDDNVGAILFMGTYLGNVDSFQGCSTLEAGMKGTPIGWTYLIDVTIIDGYFFGLLRQPAGGFYDLKIRPVYQGQPGAAMTVYSVGVGEVFITAGQSNSTNNGTPTGFLPSVLVSSFNFGLMAGVDPTFPGASWQYGVDPQPVEDGSRGGSTWPTMATDLANAMGVPIGICSVGFGGTSVANWLPGNVLIPASATNPAILMFGRLKHTIEYLSSRGGVRAVLWIQGETDFGNDANPALYQADLQFIIDQSRAETGVPIKWMVAKTATCLTDDKPAERLGIEQAQAAVVDNLLTFSGPNADLIGLSFRIEVPGGPLHFNAAGLELLGGYWAIYVFNTPGFLNIGHLPPI